MHPLSRILLLLTIAALFSCNNHNPPKFAFDASVVPPAPDYSQQVSWAALPGMKDSADSTPPGVSPEKEENAAADVFFIHPTTLNGGDVWNADLADSDLNLNTDLYPIRHQASIFNEAGKVYAPRYRQMCLGGFFTDDTASEHRALDLAYADVKASFEYYLAHYNAGRPIIIASHSQGSFHALRLLSEFFDGKPLQQQLVAAYVVGWPFKADRFAHIPVCTEPSQTGCVVGWCTWLEGAEPDNLHTFYQNAVVVNPISWKTDCSLAPESAHLGFLWRDYARMRTNDLYAQAHEGILWVKRPIPLVPQKNYHVGDYNLFWLDVRKNADLRAKEFLLAGKDD